MRYFEYPVEVVTSLSVEFSMGACAFGFGDRAAVVLFQDGRGYVIQSSDFTTEGGGVGENVKDFWNGDLAAAARNVESYFPSRAKLAEHLLSGRSSAVKSANVDPGVYALRTAAPLCSEVTLKNTETFFRYTARRTDLHLSASGDLAADTYMTSRHDTQYANTGFGAVGRYSLPCPYPARYIHRYRLPAGTSLRVGTVEPNFNQSGGGVEVRLVDDTPVKSLGSVRIDDY